MGPSWQDNCVVWVELPWQHVTIVNICLIVVWPVAVMIEWEASPAWPALSCWNRVLVCEQIARLIALPSQDEVPTNNQAIARARYILFLFLTYFWYYSYRVISLYCCCCLECQPDAPSVLPLQLVVGTARGSHRWHDLSRDEPEGGTSG